MGQFGEVVGEMERRGEALRGEVEAWRGRCLQAEGEAREAARARGQCT